MKKYTIKTKYYNDNTVQEFTNSKDWEEEINSISCEENTRGRGESFTIAIYEAPEESEVEYNIIPEDWELIEEEEVLYWSYREIWAEKTIQEDGTPHYTYIANVSEDKPETEEGEIIEAYMDDMGDIYEDEQELIEINNPSGYLTI